MKAKKVLIVHMLNGINNIASYSYILQKVSDELESEGRMIVRRTQRQVEFQDGTTIDVIPIGTHTIGKKVTHLYFEEAILKMSGGKRYITDILLKLVLKGGNYNNLDATEEVEERIMMFNENKVERYIK